MTPDARRKYPDADPEKVRRAVEYVVRQAYADQGHIVSERTAEEILLGRPAGSMSEGMQTPQAD